MRDLHTSISVEIKFPCFDGASSHENILKLRISARTAYELRVNGNFQSAAFAVSHSTDLSTKTIDLDKHLQSTERLPCLRSGPRWV